MDALLIIDAQKALLQGSFLENEVLCAIQVASNKIRENGGIVVFVQHCHTSFKPMMKGAPGWELHESLDVRSGDLRIEKQASDSFYESELDDALRSHGVDRLFITGLQTEYCVDATCRSALSRGYEVTLISDGHTTGDAQLPASQIIQHHNAVLANLAHPTKSIKVFASTEL